MSRKIYHNEETMFMKRQLKNNIKKVSSISEQMIHQEKLTEI